MRSLGRLKVGTLVSATSRKAAPNLTLRRREEGAARFKQNRHQAERGAFVPA
jgi:hypothetical protein